MIRFFLLILFFYCFSGFAQITIVLRNLDSGDPVVGGKLALSKRGETQYFLSDLSGEIELSKTCEGKYNYQVTAIGFDTVRSELNVDKISPEKPLVQGMQPNRLFDAVLVTAQYEPTIVNNATQKATIISADQIERSGAVNLSDILTYQTGIRLSQDNILGSSMSLGGLSGQNVKILIDGVPVIGRQDGNIDLSQINLSNIERIEIIEGPLSVNYGTNALAGTINLITKKNQNKAIDISVNPYYESIGDFNLNGAAGIKFKRHNFRVSGGRNFFDGWSATDEFFRFPKSRPADTSRFKTWKPKEQWFVDTRYTTQLKSWTVSPFVRYFDELIVNRGYPIAPYDQYALDDYYQTLRKGAGFNVQKQFKKAQLRTIFAYNQFERKKNTYVKDLTNLTQSLSEANGAQDTALFSLINLRSVYIQPLGKKWVLEGGLDLNYETAYGKRIVGLEKDQGDYAAYFTSEWEAVKGLKIKPGFRYAYNTNYESPITPSLNLFYKTKNFRFRTAIARGFRAPTLKELYFDFVDINHDIKGNTALQSEYSYNYSGNVTWLKVNEKSTLFQVDYSAFYNDIENLITLGLLPGGSYTYVNIGTYKTVGNQLKFSVKNERLTTTLAASYTGRYNQLSSDYSGVNKFNFSPETSLNLSYDLIADKLQINSFCKFNGALQSFGVVDDQIIENRQSAYTILDLSLSTQLLKNQLKITAGAKNLLNVTNVDVVGTAGSGGAHAGGGNFNAGRGTSVFVNVKYNFSYDFKKK